MIGVLENTFSASVGGTPDRQTKPARRKRGPTVSIRVSEDERAALIRETDGDSLNAYLRARMFGTNAASGQRRRHSGSVKDREALARILASLGRSRLPSNLNQIARLAHVGKLPVSENLAVDLREACSDISAMRRDLIAALGLKPQ